MRGLGRVVEAEKAFSYREFVAKHRELLASGRGSIGAAWQAVNDQYLKNFCPPIRYVAKGSSRAAYALTGGKCLKIATSSVGIDQNRQELANVPVGQQKYSCFTRNFECDAETYGSLVTECCSEAEHDDVYDLYKLNSLDDVVDMLRDAITKANCSPQTLLDMYLDDIANERGSRYYISLLQSYAEILRGMSKPNPDPQYRVLADLVQFYADHGGKDNDLLVDDLSVIENWGIANRDGMLCMVILDAGFSLQISRKV